MRKLGFAVVILAVSLGIAWAAVSSEVLSFSKTNSQIDWTDLYEELESSTGLQYEADCSTCVQHGSVNWRPDTLTVTTWTALHPGEPRLSSATWTQALEDAITDTVNAHTP